MSTAIVPAIISEKKRPRILPTSDAGFPYYPANTAVPANTPTAIPLEQLSRRIVIQNNNGFAINRKYEGDCSASSFTIAAGATLVDIVRADTLYLFAGTATFVNPTQGQGLGIVVETYP